MPPGHSNSNSIPPTVALAEGAVEAAREYSEKENVTDEVKAEILQKAERLEEELADMEPVKGRDRISGYEAPSMSVNRAYQELMEFLQDKNIILEVEVPEDPSS